MVHKFLIYFLTLFFSCANSFAIEKEFINEKSIDSSYKISVGDELKIAVYGEKDLSGNYEVDANGNINMPLIGLVLATNKTVKELEYNIIKSYKKGYLVNPSVGVEVTNFRPFFIVGEVKNPGSYSYKNGLTVLNSVAIAGGYTYRANKKKIVIERGSDEKSETFKVKETEKVLPGDTIRVKERYF